MTVAVTRDMFGLELTIEHDTHTESVALYRSNVAGRCGLIIRHGTESTGVVLDPEDAIELARWIIDTFDGGET